MNRSNVTVPRVLLAAGLAGLALQPDARAQEFDDEFDDRQIDQSLEQARETEAVAETVAAEAEPATPTTDEFGESAPAASEEPRSTPPSAEGSPTDERGDLLSADGSRAWRARRFTMHNTWGASTGGLRIVDAASGPSQSFRVQLLTNFFFQNGFINPDDDHRQIGGSLSLTYTPFDFLELYGSIRSYANSNATESPALFQVLGDSTFGVKAWVDLAPWFSLGLDVGAYFLNTVGDIGPVLDSTSFNFRLNASADLRAAAGIEFPLIARLNAGYYLDRSTALTDAVEQARYDALPTTGPDARRSFMDEDRHLLSQVERFALNINRTDFLNLGIGFEFPIMASTDFMIAPIAEWQIGVPINSRNYSCLWLPETPGGSTPVGGEDGCLEFQGFSAFPSSLTLGLRVTPGIRGLAITAAADIGTSGQTFVRELAGTAPYNIMLGLAYAVDASPVPPQVIEREVERTVEVRIPPPVRGHVIGTVVERGTSTPVSGAVVRYTGLDLTAMAAGADGRFTTSELDPGEVSFTVSHPEYRDGTCSGTIPEDGADATITCELEALPRFGNVRGRLVSDAGQAVVGATVTLTGPQGATFVSDPSGGFAQQNLPPGQYTARVEGDAYFITQQQFEIRARETAEPQITVIARPRRSLVSLRARELVIRRQVNFATDSSEILGDSAALLAEIADVLQRHPELTAIEIQGHTDNRGASEHNLELSQRRAEAVRTWLVGLGVAPERLTAQGYGDTRPIAPNITAGGRARNRRSQFMITSRADASE